MHDRWAGALVLVAAVLAGCATTASTLDRAETERAVQRVIGGRLTVPVEQIRCPAAIERGAGRRFECRAVLGDVTGVVRLRVTQADDDALEVEPLDAVIDRTVVAEDLRRTLVETYARSFTVACARPDLWVAAPGSTFTCRATDDTGHRDIGVTLVDATGTVSYDVGT